MGILVHDGYILCNIIIHARLIDIHKVKSHIIPNAEIGKQRYKNKKKKFNSCKLLSK